MEVSWIYGYNEIENMRITKTKLGCPELHAGSKRWVLLFEALKVKGLLGFEVLVHVSTNYPHYI
jgi:hypothetical protein